MTLERSRLISRDRKTKMLMYVGCPMYDPVGRIILSLDCCMDNCLKFSTLSGARIFRQRYNNNGVAPLALEIGRIK